MKKFIFWVLVLGMGVFVGQLLWRTFVRAEQRIANGFGHRKRMGFGAEMARDKGLAPA